MNIYYQAYNKIKKRTVGVTSLGFDSEGNVKHINGNNADDYILVNSVPLKGKDGKSIFVGDKTREILDDGTVLFGVVEFKKEWMNYVITYGENDHIELHEFDDGDIEVVGNIFGEYELEE